MKPLAYWRRTRARRSILRRVGTSHSLIEGGPWCPPAPGESLFWNSLHTLDKPRRVGGKHDEFPIRPSNGRDRGTKVALPILEHLKTIRSEPRTRKGLNFSAVVTFQCQTDSTRPTTRPPMISAQSRDLIRCLASFWDKTSSQIPRPLQPSI